MRIATSPLDVTKYRTILTIRRKDREVAEVQRENFRKAADVIAVKGDPIADVRLLEQVQFVMKAGQVYKSE